MDGRIKIEQASKFVELKQRVKNEMNRRNQIGSLTAYGGSQYDYSVAPETGKPILTEHGYKIWYPLERINSTGVAEPVSGGLLPDFAPAESFLNTSAAIPMGVKNNSNCRESCSGLCQTKCTTSCAGGCSGGCSGDCDGSCRGGCEGNCSGYCTRACGDTACGVICEGSCYQSAN